MASKATILGMKLQEILEDWSDPPEQGIVNEALEEMDELKVRRVVRRGKVMRKRTCPPGYKYSNGRCVRIAPKERRARKRAAKRAARKRVAKMAQINRRRKLSLRKRRMSGL